MHDAPNTDAKWTDIHLRFPEYSQDDLINDEHSEVTKLNALRPWIIRYLPGDPRPAGCDGTNTKSYPVVRRICRGSPNGDWYVHWSQDGHKSWQLLQWNLADRCYHLHHQDGSIQRVEWVQQGGVPGSFVDESERRSNDNEIVIPLLTKQEVNQIQTHKTVYAYHTDTDESESPKPRRPGRNYQVRRQSQYTKSVSPLSDESKSGLKRTLGGKVVPFSDEGNRQELLPSKLVNREVSHPFSDSRDHTLHRQSSCTQRVSAKAIPRQVTVKPCVLDDHFVWGEWSYGKLSSLDVASLFMRVAESYNIDTSTLEEVEFHFIDLMPEETDIVRRGSVSDFEQVMSRIREEVRTNAETYTSFWVGLRPVIKATDGDVDIDM
ncbi:hypothetical protein MMC14_008842 [Varicellaria rhodocarpa]|nr:hypothetical protein [Varicellaria rhodocarpa]